MLMIKKLAQFFLVFLTLTLLVGVIGHTLRSAFEKRTEFNYFFQALDSLPETHSIVTWSENQPRGRKLAENNRVDIATKITESWRAYAFALDNENANYLKDYFTGTALERSQHVLESEEAQGSNMVLMGMEVDPILFHRDGSIFQLQSENALFARYVINDNQLSAYELSKDCILENYVIRQSGWKLANHELRCSNPISLEAPEQTPWHFPKLKGMNYYPKNSPWSFFWRDYDKSIVKQDIARMKSLGVNAIRIFLTYNAFTEDQSQEAAIENLSDFFEQTEAAGLYVVPTLFDLRGELSSWTWLTDRYYLDTVLPTLAEAKNIAYVDLKNEPDIDQDYQDPALVEAWLMTMLGVSREIAPELRYSIGWARAENALKFQDMLDVISYHEYGPIGSIRENFEQIKSGAPDKPVILSEIGETSYELGLGLPSDFEKQASNLQERVNHYEDSDGVFIWTLYDFPVLDPKAISGSFWNKGIQKNFGLYDEFERAKPAARIWKDWNFE